VSDYEKYGENAFPGNEITIYSYQAKLALSNWNEYAHFYEKKTISNKFCY